MDKGADISECGKYRYRLWRKWDDSKPLMGWIMLNPSTANAAEDDPTIRKCKGFAKRHDFGGIMVMNLWALRATDPRELHAVYRRGESPIGPDNDAFLRTEAGACKVTVCAWGNHALLQGRGAVVLHRLRRQTRSAKWGRPTLCHLGTLTKLGEPRHPLYLPYSTPLLEFE